VLAYEARRLIRASGEHVFAHLAQPEHLPRYAAPLWMTADTVEKRGNTHVLSLHGYFIGLPVESVQRIVLRAPAAVDFTQTRGTLRAFSARCTLGSVEDGTEILFRVEADPVHQAVAGRDPEGEPHRGAVRVVLDPPRRVAGDVDPLAVLQAEGLVADPDILRAARHELVDLLLRAVAVEGTPGVVGRQAARNDAKSQRKTSTLDVIAIHHEDAKPSVELREPPRAEITLMAGWLGLEHVRYVRGSGAS